MHARQANAREIAAKCAQIKGDEGEFAASGKIRVEGNKRAAECCPSPPLQLHIYEFDAMSRFEEERNIARQSFSLSFLPRRYDSNGITRSEARTRKQPILAVNVAALDFHLSNETSSCIRE